MTDITIRAVADVGPAPLLFERLDEIFFEASNTKYFEAPAAREAYRERWLGRYLAYFPKTTFLALDGEGRLAGYVAGALDDPARDPLFSDIPYFETFKALTRLFPAHLHINLAPEFRNKGIGGQLVARFAEAVRGSGKPGLHAVTSRQARNVGFYMRNGFAPAQYSGAGAKEIVFLARAV